jgi:hypothetical protein
VLDEADLAQGLVDREGYAPERCIVALANRVLEQSDRGRKLDLLLDLVQQNNKGYPGKRGWLRESHIPMVFTVFVFKSKVG